MPPEDRDSDMGFEIRSDTALKGPLPFRDFHLSFAHIESAHCRWLTRLGVADNHAGRTRPGEWPVLAAFPPSAQGRTGGEAGA